MYNSLKYIFFVCVLYNILHVLFLKAVFEAKSQTMKLSTWDYHFSNEYSRKEEKVFGYKYCLLLILRYVLMCVI